MVANRFGFPDLGVGIGLRGCHVRSILEETPSVGFFEVLSENFMGHDGPSMEDLDLIAAIYPVVLHGVSLSIGSSDPLDLDYLKCLSALANRARPVWISDHICWTGVGGRNSHDLLPLPCTEAALRHVVARVREVSDRLERPLVLENPSGYVTFRASTMPEHEFVARLAEEADCGLLLDVNNVWVSACNQGFDPNEYVDAMPADRVVQIHVAGHVDRGDHLLDTHSRPVAEPVWRLLDRFRQRSGSRATLLEWDADIPPLEVVLAEANRARSARSEAVDAR